MLNFCSVGGSFQWPPAKEEEVNPPTYIDPKPQSQQLSQQSVQTQQNQSYQQTSYQSQSQQSYSSSQQQVTQQKPVSILKQPTQQQPVQQASQQYAEPETWTPGPGQSVTAPRRGRGELMEQQPGMRTPICGACESQIRQVLAVEKVC